MQEARVQKLNHSECSPRPRSTHGALRKQHPATPAAFPEMCFHTSEGRRAGKEHINNPDTSSFPFNKLLQLPWRNMSSAHGLNPLEHFQGLGFDKASSALGNNVVLHRDRLHPCWTSQAAVSFFVLSSLKPRWSHSWKVKIVWASAFKVEAVVPSPWSRVLAALTKSVMIRATGCCLCMATLLLNGSRAHGKCWRAYNLYQPAVGFCSPQVLSCSQSTLNLWHNHLPCGCTLMS